ncbi:MAG: D-alanine--D-alanine ligase family protein [Oscillospiraceae bacterium]
MKTNVGVFFGCMSVEHEISIISAVQAMHSIDKTKYDITPVYVTKQGELYTGDALFDMDNYKDFGALIPKCHPVNITNTNGKVMLRFSDNKAFKKNPPIELNVAFPIVHGTNCEDGSIQGFFEMLAIPYVGCDVLSSAIGMDKVFFKSVLLAENVPVLPCVSFYDKEYSKNRDLVLQNIEDKFGYPVIIKPANLGSSVGISKAKNRDELSSAIELALSFSDKILAERAVTSMREINCSVLGDTDHCEASVLEEPIMHDEILTYDNKYRGDSGSKGMASLSRKLPAELSDEKAEEIKEIAKKAFRAIGGSGVCRIDFIIDTADNDKVYVNEANTIPGSLSFYLWEAGGKDYSRLIDEMISLAFKRARKRANLMFTLNTNILSEKSFGFKGSKGVKRQ